MIFGRILKARRLMKIFQDCVNNPEDYLDERSVRLGKDFFVNFWKDGYNDAAKDYNRSKFWFMPKAKLYEIEKQ